MYRFWANLQHLPQLGNEHESRLGSLFEAENDAAAYAGNDDDIYDNEFPLADLEQYFGQT